MRNRKTITVAVSEETHAHLTQLKLRMRVREGMRGITLGEVVELLVDYCARTSQENDG